MGYDQKAAEHAYINNHRIFNNPRRISKLTSKKKKKKTDHFLDGF